MASAGTSISTACRTTLSVPPRLMPGADFAVDEVHRHFHADELAGLEAQEVDVQREVLDGIQLVVARDHARLRALDVDLELRGQEVAGENELLGFTCSRAKWRLGASPPP